MHPHLKSLLVKAGCDSTASDDDAQKFYDGMAVEKKTEVDGALAKLMDGGDDSSTGLSEPPPPGVAVAVPATLSAKQISDIATRAAIAAVQAATSVDSVAVARLSANLKPVAGTPGDDDVALAVETQRVNRVRGLAALHKLPEAETNRIVAAGGKFEDARLAVLKYVSDNAKPIAGLTRVGEDRAIASLRSAIPQGLLLRAGVEAKTFEKHGETLHPRAREMASLSFRNMFQQHMASLGCSEVYQFSDVKLASCMGPRGMRQHFPRLAALAESTSDFSSITLDAQNKSLRFFYLDAKRTWPIWAQKAFAPDFKNINRVVLSEAPNMVSRNEGGELQYVQLQDSKEVYALSEYASAIRLTRRAMINDDLSAFTAIPRYHANSAARKEDDVAYNVVTVNANMADGTAVFASGHSNYTSSGTAISVSSLQVGKTAVKKQKGLAGAARLELEPKFLLAPTSIEESAIELIGSDTLIASQSSSGSAPTTVGNKNPFFNRYQVVGSTRLDDNSATAWYLVADYRDGQVNTIEVCFLTDEPEPVIRQETDFDSEDIKMLCRHTVAAKAIDFRGLYKNAGA